MPRPLKYHQVVAILLEHGVTVLDRRGKGSERILRHPNVDGRPVNCTITCHGPGTEIGRGLLSHIIRTFKLPRNIFD